MAKGRNGFNQYDAMVFERVLARYNHCCAGCSMPLDLERDHIVPVNAGGTDDEFNLMPLCHHCNNRKNGMKGFPRLEPRQPEDSCKQIALNRLEFIALCDRLRGKGK